MKATIYRNTKTNLPGWVDNLHLSQPRGYAYEYGNYFIHIYGRDNGFWILSSGLTASQANSGNLNNWISNIFGADEITQSTNSVGEVVSGVWRPCLYYQENLYQALSTNEFEQRFAEQALRVLIDKLDELLLYIEPSPDGLNSYSHKTRELLILACTEVENSWTQYMQIASATPNGRNFNTTDYVKLSNHLHLKEYELRLRPYASMQGIKPFNNWSSAAPTQSIDWYDAYNKTKHNRNTHFSDATLLHCIEAIAANVVMFCVRYSPYALIGGQSSLSVVFNQLFSISLFNPDPCSFYVPKISLPTSGYRQDLVCGETKEFFKPWIIKPLNL